MRILICHNSYQQRGGEDSVVEAEAELLRSNGHDVEIYSRYNDDIKAMSALSVAAQTVWSGRTIDEVSELIGSFCPDVIHVHNTLPLISPSIYWVASKYGIPVVQTLHNYRLACLNGLYLRGGDVCEDCAGVLPWRGVVRRCYRDSVAASAILGSMLALHRGLGSYRNKVDCYIALTEFARNKFIEAGIPEGKVRVKPNFISTGSLEKESEPPLKKGAIFVGRLSREKGIETLAAAWRHLEVPLRVVGDGPSAEKISHIERSQIELLGMLDRKQVFQHMRRSSFFVMPSEWYEGFPMVILEAFSQRLPVIASCLGSMAEIVEDGVTGLHFEAGNAEDLAEKVRWMNEHPEECRQMGINARKVYEEKYTPEKNHKLLMAVYKEVCNIESDA